MTWDAQPARGKLDCDGLVHAGKDHDYLTDNFLIADVQSSLLVRRSSLSVRDRDRILACGEGQLMMVASGIGEGQSARHASTLSVEETARSFVEAKHDGHLRPDDMEHRMNLAMRVCQDRLRRERASAAGSDSLGATLTLAYVDWPRVFIGHAGDSRCYRFRNQRLEQITTDHTLAQRSVAQGVLEAQQAASSPWNNVLYNALTSGERDVHPETHSATLAIGDTLLLCTKGLPSRLPDHRLIAILREDRPAGETCARLADAASAVHDRDDLAVVVARFRSAERYQQLEAEMAAQAESSA